MPHLRQAKTLEMAWETRGFESLPQTHLTPPSGAHHWASVTQNEAQSVHLNCRSAGRSKMPTQGRRPRKQVGAAFLLCSAQSYRGSEKLRPGASRLRRAASPSLFERPLSLSLRQPCTHVIFFRTVAQALRIRTTSSRGLFSLWRV